MTNAIIDNCLSFICSTCCYASKNRVQRFIAIPGVQQKPKTCNPIQLEHFLAETDEESTEDDAVNIDYYRYQTGPDQSEKLMKCTVIKRIVQLIENIVNLQVIKGEEDSVSQYCVTKVTILYSKPGGTPQTLHVDDQRTDMTRMEEGEMLSAIVGLQEGTRLDIAGDDGERLTYSIPPKSMFLFSGLCKHGGSSYIRHNVRLHMYLLPKQFSTNADNVIVVNKPCPLDGCLYSNEGETFNESQLYYHWNKYHVSDIGLSVGKFIKKCNGEDVLQCECCKKGFNTKRGLARHKKHKCRGRKSLRQPVK